MTQEEFEKAPLLDQILYNETGLLVKNHPSIAEAMKKYHQAKLKLLGITDVSICSCGSTKYYSEQYKDVTKYYCSSCHEKIESKN